MASAGDIVAYARQQLGKPYVFGAEGPGAFDCSGLVQYVYGHFGVHLPRGSRDQAKVGTEVPRNQIQAGDLVFSAWNGEAANGHVGIAVDPTHIINAPHTGAVVRVQELNAGYMQHVTAIRRVGGVSGDGSLLGKVGGIGGAIVAGGGGGDGGIVGPLVQPLRDIASAAASGASVADKLLQVFIPSNFVRLVSGLTGAVLILFGLLLLTKEVRA